MRLRFPHRETAIGFAQGLGDPDGYDLVATVEDETVVEILGIDDIDSLVEELKISARGAGGVEVP